MGDSTGVSVSLGGGIYSGGKKYRESNISDSDNTGDGGTRVGGGIKGLNVLSKVALSEAAQHKEATKRSKKDFHISHASGLGDGTDFESRVLDEQQRKISGTDKGTGTKQGVLDVPKYDSESEKESWGDSGEEEDDEEDYKDESDDAKGNNDDVTPPF
ncbi:hypothetical protein Tco_0727546 [Tanacetum coccineum]|uniref:Uncharacterized protein n=1 Tax=Tanacetum coccineum TaxID=301880 RepID=A0ABQ4YKZ7_9ASTR